MTTDYQSQKSQNKEKFAEFLKTVNPNLYMLYDTLETMGVNYFVVVKIIRALHNVATGSGYGTVNINIENGRALFVKGEQSDRVNEKIIIDSDYEQIS